MAEYCPSSLQITREIAFYTTTYDPAILVVEVIQQFKKKLLYCRHLCSDDTSLIRVLSMRLAHAVLLHLSTTEFTSLSAFLRAVTLYDEQRRRSIEISVPPGDGKH